jgi:hypothetical protein
MQIPSCLRSSLSLSVLLIVINVLLLIITNHESSHVQAVTVSMRNFNHQRTGTNLEEKLLNSTNVNEREFGLVFTRDVVGHIYSQLLYIPNVRIPATGLVHNVLYVATMANNVYAFDADDASRAQPLWQKNFGPSLPVDDGKIGVPSAHCDKYTDIQIEVGIVSTPVIDVATNTMYFVATNKDSNVPYVVNHRLHAIDITTGDEKPNSPILVNGKVPGNGLGSENGVLTFNNLKQNQRLALTLHNGIVYFGFASYCTAQPYHGWIFGYDAVTLQQKLIFTTTPNSDAGGVWQSGNGFLIDENNNFYCITANGHYDGKTEWANSYLKLDMSKVRSFDQYTNVLSEDAVVDHFTPFNEDFLGEYDLDLGTSGPTFIPGTDLIFGCGKQGYCYLVNKNNMGGFNPNGNNNVMTFKPNPNSGEEYWNLSTGTHGNVCSWVSQRKGTMVYTWPINDSLRALHLAKNGNLGTFDLGASERAPDMATGRPLFPGGILSCSGDNYKYGTGIVWATHAVDGSANRIIRRGVVRAFDAEDINRELWSSERVPNRDRPQAQHMFAKFNPALAINGRVYLPTWSQPPNNACKVYVYGLLAPQTPRTTVRINCGGPEFTDSKGRKWEDDQSTDVGHGDIGTTTARDIQGTEDDTLFLTERFGDVTYNVGNLVNGDYVVRLYFAETFDDDMSNGKRQFSVTVNGRTSVSKLDIFRTVGPNKRYIVNLKGTVSNNRVDISLKAIKESPKINAIEIVKL